MEGTLGIAKSETELRSYAYDASTDFLQNGTPLTDAVVKVASMVMPLTDEHVRRICEMTYHNTYERMFKEASSPDKYISFDPPNAIEACERLRSVPLEKQAGRGMAALGAIGGDIVSREEHLKTASLETIGPLSSRRLANQMMGQRTEDGQYIYHPEVEQKRRVGRIGGRILGSVIGAGIPNLMGQNLFHQGIGGAAGYFAGQHIGERMGENSFLRSQGMNRGVITSQVPTGAVSGLKLANGDNMNSYTPVNRFDEHIKTESSSDNWHDPNKEIRDLFFQTKEAKKDLEGQIKSASISIQHDFLSLVKQAKMLHNEGLSVHEILKFASAKTENTPKDLMANLAGAFDLSKEAAAPNNEERDFNLNHPFPAFFSKLAEDWNNKKHLEMSLSEIESNLDYFNKRIIEFANGNT